MKEHLTLFPKYISIITGFVIRILAVIVIGYFTMSSWVRTSIVIENLRAGEGLINFTVIGIFVFPVITMVLASILLFDLEN